MNRRVRLVVGLAPTVVLAVLVLVVVNPFAAQSAGSAYRSIQVVQADGVGVSDVEDGEIDGKDVVGFEQLTPEQQREFEEYLGGRTYELASRPALAEHAADYIAYRGDVYTVLIAVA